MDMEVLKYVAAGLMAFGMFGAAVGVGLVFNGALQGIARNPSVEKNLLKGAFIGAAFAEFMGLMAFASMFILLNM